MATTGEPRLQRAYSDDDRANALAALAANGGNVKGTARQLGMPERTLHRWANGGVNEFVARSSDEKRADLSDRLEDVAHQLLDCIPGKVGKAGLREVATALGIAVDKMQVLRGLPNSIHGDAELTDEQRLERLRELAERARSRRLGLPDAAGAPPMGPVVGNGHAALPE